MKISCALSKVGGLDTNLTAKLEELRKPERESWPQEYKKAIDALNELADKNGLFSDAYREF